MGYHMAKNKNNVLQMSTNPLVMHLKLACQDDRTSWIFVLWKC